MMKKSWRIILFVIFMTLYIILSFFSMKYSWATAARLALNATLLAIFMIYMIRTKRRMAKPSKKEENEDEEAKKE